MPSPTHGLSAVEKSAYRDEGYVVRRGTFGDDEVADIVAECESVVARLVSDRRAERTRFGSYTFDFDLDRGVVIKWEGDSDIVHGIEPVAHLSLPLKDWAYDPRFVDPMRDIVGSERPELFTEKLNLKRPHHGGENPLHQDYPYWIKVADVAADVATAMLFLDDATLDNGCLWVAPGSHLKGEWPRRESGDRFADYELDADAFGEIGLVPVEVPKGSLILFGPLLVHRSAPNLSAMERRALLYSYQPSGRRTQLENLQRRPASNRD